MSDHKKRKKSRKHDDHYDDKPKSSLVDYSKVSARPDGAPLRRSGPAEAPSVSTGPQLPPVGGAAAAPPKMSAQMEAVVRLMAGVEERTIAQKLADSNRPTWEQYKKDNEDRLNLDGKWYPPCSICSPLYVVRTRGIYLKLFDYLFSLRFGSKKDGRI